MVFQLSLRAMKNQNQSGRRVLILIMVLMSMNFVRAQEFTGEQYKKALWMATRFLGAQRSGSGPNWILQQTSYPQSFVLDSYNGVDMSGGWFDCGDHVMFGQTQYFAAYTIAKAMETYPNAWWDLYHGDYSDYKASGDYSIVGGQPNGVPDILEELRYEADFVVKAAPNPTTFLFQKGDATKDHSKWIHGGLLSTMPNNSGGEKEGSRPILVNPNDAYAPGMAAAFLALMARIDPDPVRKQLYLRHAVYAFLYSSTHNGVQTSTPFYYASSWDGRWREARALAGWELYQSTQDLTFRDYAKAEYDSMTSGMYSRFEYANAVPLARLVMQPTFDFQFLMINIEAYMQKYRDSVSAGDGVTTAMQLGGFPTRAPTGAAYLHGMYSMVHNTTEFDFFTFRQIDYMLGSNSNNQTYMIGWDEDGKKQVTAPHHRGFWLNEDYMEKNDPTLFNTAVGPSDTKYLGGVIGGALDGTYIRDVENYKFNESCVDMNATWIGALAFAVQKLSPTPEPWVANRPTIAKPMPTWKLRQEGAEWVILGARKGQKFEWITPNGQRALIQNERFQPTETGVHIIRMLQGDGNQQVQSFVHIIH